MKKLTIKELAPYLPFGLKALVIYSTDDKEICTLSTRDDKNNVVGIHSFLINGYPIKPILRPLSDLTKEIEVNGERFVPIKRIEFLFDINKDWFGWEELTVEKCLRIELPYEVWQKLFEWHFDLFNLIPQNLAIDINTLQNER